MIQDNLLRCASPFVSRQGWECTPWLELFKGYKGCTKQRASFRISRPNCSYAHMNTFIKFTQLQCNPIVLFDSYLNLIVLSLVAASKSMKTKQLVHWGISLHLKQGVCCNILQETIQPKSFKKAFFSSMKYLYSCQLNGIMTTFLLLIVPWMTQDVRKH